jgi:hypothetical protein
MAIILKPSDAKLGGIAARWLTPSMWRTNFRGAPAEFLPTRVKELVPLTRATCLLTNRSPEIINHRFGQTRFGRVE